MSLVNRSAAFAKGSDGKGGVAGVCSSDVLPADLCLFSQARLAVNSVTAGDYSRPLRISTFINELDSGFRLLNLKNDSLRKRYDGLKYDVKKIEEVVYDLSIRGLNKEAAGGTGGEK